jgi:cbb3-type cytochrome oxidase subunit 3
VGEVVVVGLILWALWPGERRQRRVAKRRGNLAVAAASFLQTASVLVLFWLYLHRRAQLGGGGQGLFGLQGPNSFPSLPTRGSAVAGGQDWLTALIVLVVIGLTASILLRGIGLSRRGSSRAPLADRLQRAVEEGLGELESEPDPRRAVIAAYARMERSLAGAGLARSGPEAAQEYLARLLGELGVSAEPARRLTDLYQLAKFSQHPIDEAMKGRAIAALVELRNELREQAEAAAVAARVATA